MRLFACPQCEEVSYFENVQCVHCQTSLAFDPTAAGLVVVTTEHKRCANFADGGCNWLAPAEDSLCVCCSLNRTIPNKADADARLGWQKIEAAKRRLVYELLDLKLPIQSKLQSPSGLTFDLLMPQDGAPVITGHADGVITLNVKEADSPFRETLRLSLGEPYRTLLGHLRHEVGHYYWDLLVAPSESRLAGFREVFGDERVSYDEALKRHYSEGAPPDWSSRCVSAYASMHPWEDWAETWAHYLHIVDAVDTGRSYGVQLRPRKDPTTGADTEKLKLPAAPGDKFDAMMAYWYPLTFALNGLNRSMGHLDWYPFALSAAAIAKLRFVHDVVAGHTAETKSKTTSRGAPAQPHRLDQAPTV
ncbi:MAG: putative zinc-binding metallopeptidase [Deltaproteobacteria bacterium]|nr:putative zinc-binding metallopeptidase [Deltaproteobacteria bacterium]